MNDYKRLTNNNIEEYDPEYDFCMGCEFYGKYHTCDRANGICANFERFIMTYNRLAELENKIENSTLVELPCKVGDTVYIITEKRDCSACYFVEDYCHHDCPFKNDKNDLVIKQGKITRIVFYRPYPFCPEIEIAIKEDKQLQQNEYDIVTYKEIGSDYFLLKAEAEAKLKELKENSNEQN